MFAEALSFLIQSIAAFFILNLLLRFFLQVVRAPFSHPLAQFVVKLTNFMVLPTRRVLPSIKGYDTASLLLAWLLAVLMHLLVLMLWSFNPVHLANPGFLLGLAALGVLELLRWGLTMLFAVLLVQAVLSWVSPFNPLMPLLDALTRRVVAPLQRVLPRLGGIDLSFLVLMLLVDMTQRFFLSPLINEVKLNTMLVMGA
ncbi:YggT family protein [Chitinimonas lacunae]|uniref:YggT family protein n=1 Tax=Chitinimonas lacunae TaxID=1963018 RepID=A0ABV8MWW4_9NEIS